MKKLSYVLLLGALVSCVSIDMNEKSVLETKTSEKPKMKASASPVSDKFEVKKSQVAVMQAIADALLKGAESLSGPEELFKVISGDFNQTAAERSTPILDAVRMANEGKYRIVCYKEGSDEIVASTDPLLIGKHADEYKTLSGKSVRNKAIEAVRASGKEQAVFTYALESKADVMVNGEPIVQKRVVLAIGRKGFPFQNAELKFVVTIGGEIDN
jgi:hypothetical protein